MQLPAALRASLHAHIDGLRKAYADRGWGRRVGFGERPAIVVIDLALGWTEPDAPAGSELDSVVEATVTLLNAARSAGVPIYFTTGHVDRSEPRAPVVSKFDYPEDADLEHLFGLDPRLQHQDNEKVIAKPYDSALKGTHLPQMLALQGVDTLIVTGCSTSHCVYATCRDAVESFHLIVPREAVGDRCELMHEVNLLDIDLALGDVLPTTEVVAYLQSLDVPGATTGHHRPR